MEQGKQKGRGRDQRIQMEEREQQMKKREQCTYGGKGRQKQSNAGERGKDMCRNWETRFKSSCLETNKKRTNDKT